MDERNQRNIITILMLLGAVGKSYYLYGDIDRVLPEYVVWPGMLAMNILALVGIFQLRKRMFFGYILGILLALFYIITMLLNIIDVFRGIHSDLGYFLYGPLALIVISIALIVMMYIDYYSVRKKIEGTEKGENTIKE